MSPFNWLLYLAVADDLMSFGSEAHFRSAVSRAYYGVFVEIRDGIGDRGVQLPKRDIHKFVRDWLRRQRPQLVQIGLDLSRLRRERVQADYFTYVVFSQKQRRSRLL